MKAEKWSRVKEIFNLAVEMNAAEREKFLSTWQNGDTSIRKEVEKLLAADDSAGANFDDFSFISLNDAQEKIGRYKILREIGAGGMGTVYLAEREDLTSQKVALKIIRRGVSSETVLRRFRREQEILAALEHPNIARLLDVGTSTEGSPFLAMEYVEGADLLTYCAEKNLSLNDKLKLFRKICDAVAYAHSRLVVHRDLKPSNILVNDKGEPKLLDFGISKLLSEENDLAEKGTVTSIGMLTPNYASPEQFRGESVSTATDVYSLGVILFELLTGKLPYDVENRRYDEVARIVCETNPQKPSDAFTQTRRIAATGNGAKTTDWGRVFKGQKTRDEGRSLKGDLDNILLKALRKDWERRYSSVEKFSDDLRRHLEGLPVTARPDKFSYRAEKFIRRNRISVALGGLLVLIFFAGVGGITWQYFRAERERRLAEKRFTEVREIANNVIFKYHDEIKGLQGATRVREIMVRDALKYLDGLQADSARNAELTRELAQAYMRIGSVQGGAYQANLGDSSGAAESYQKAMTLLEPLAENSSDTRILADLRDAYTESSRALYRIGEFDKQNENLRKAFALSEKILTLEPDNIEPKIYHARSLVHLGDSIPEAEMPRKMETFRAALQLADEIIKIAPEDETANRMLGSATHRVQFYTFLEAEKAKRDNQFERQRQLLQEALPVAKRSTATQEKVSRLKPENQTYRRNVAGAKLNEGKIYRELGDTDAALLLAKEALEIQLPIAEKDPENQEIKLDLKETYEDMSFAFVKRGEIRAATENFQRAASYNEELLKKDPENFDFWIARLRGEQYFANALLEKGERQAAKVTYQKALDIADARAPEKFASFVADFKKQIEESLLKCS